MRARLSAALVWIGSVAGGAWWGFGSPSTDSSLTFLSVGQGDCTVIRDGPRTILVDAGPASEEFDAGARYVVPALRHRGITHVDLVLLTHPDADHIGGLVRLRARLPIRRVAVSAAFRGHPDLTKTLERAGWRPQDVIWLQGDVKMKTSGCELFIRAPNLEDPARDNEGSLFIWVRLPGLTAVITGDAGEETEVVQAGRGDWHADILKAGHHGSADSSSAIWLQEVKPKVAVISCGRNNRYGHPASAALDRIRAAGASVLRTDLDGDIEFQATGRGFRRRSD